MEDALAMFESIFGTDTSTVEEPLDVSNLTDEQGFRNTGGVTSSFTDVEYVPDGAFVAVELDDGVPTIAWYFPNKDWEPPVSDHLTAVTGTYDAENGVLRNVTEVEA